MGPPGSCPSCPEPPPGAAHCCFKFSGIVEAPNGLLPNATTEPQYIADSGVVVVNGNFASPNDPTNEFGRLSEVIYPISTDCEVDQLCVRLVTDEPTLRPFLRFTATLLQIPPVGPPVQLFVVTIPPDAPLPATICAPGPVQLLEGHELALVGQFTNTGGIELEGDYNFNVTAMLC